MLLDYTDDLELHEVGECTECGKSVILYSCALHKNNKLSENTDGEKTLVSVTCGKPIHRGCNGVSINTDRGMTDFCREHQSFLTTYSLRKMTGECPACDNSVLLYHCKECESLTHLGCDGALIDGEVYCGVHFEMNIIANAGENVLSSMYIPFIMCIYIIKSLLYF